MSEEGDNRSETYVQSEVAGGSLCYRICDIPARLRPREAIERQGVENVSDEVILAVLLRTGSRGLTVLDLAERILFKYGSLTALARASVEDLSQARGLDHERFWTLNLDTRNRLKGTPREISKGILDASLVHAREVFKSAIQLGGAALVLVHNHPSGDPSPSAEDIKLTRQLVQAGQVIGIKVLDHIIVGRKHSGKSKDFLSLRESGLVTFDE